ncbi:MAG: hypothetical protein GX616_10050 [Planctomycetes bacterium]|nr:hypothetical protein [Planctomycetota bacterium]
MTHSDTVPMIKMIDRERSLVERANFEHLCRTLRATVYELRGSRLRVCFRHPTAPGIDCEFTAYRYDYWMGQFKPASSDAGYVMLPVVKSTTFAHCDPATGKREWFSAYGDIQLTGKGSRNLLLRARLAQLICDTLWNYQEAA